MALFLKTIEQDDNLALIVDKEYPEYVPSIFSAQFIEAVPYKLDKLLGKPVVGFKQ